MLKTTHLWDFPITFSLYPFRIRSVDKSNADSLHTAAEFSSDHKKIAEAAVFCFSYFYRIILPATGSFPFRSSEDSGNCVRSLFSK